MTRAAALATPEEEPVTGTCNHCGERADDAVVRVLSPGSGPDVPLIYHADMSACGVVVAD